MYHLRDQADLRGCHPPWLITTSQVLELHYYFILLILHCLLTLGHIQWFYGFFWIKYLTVTGKKSKGQFVMHTLFLYFRVLDETTKGWYMNELHFLLTLYLLLPLVKMRQKQNIVLLMVITISQLLKSSTVSLFSNLLLCWSLLCKWVSVILCVQTELCKSLWCHTVVDMGPQCQHHTSSLRLEGTLSVIIETKKTDFSDVHGEAFWHAVKFLAKNSMINRNNNKNIIFGLNYNDIYDVITFMNQ